MTPYVILKAEDPATLADHVNAAIEQGYIPLGGISIDRWDTSNQTVTFYQAITLRRDKRTKYRIRPNPYSLPRAYAHLPTRITDKLSLEDFTAAIDFAVNIKKLVR